jgi:hypothetical protein
VFRVSCSSMLFEHLFFLRRLRPTRKSAVSPRSFLLSSLSFFALLRASFLFRVVVLEVLPVCTVLVSFVLFLILTPSPHPYI